MAVWPWVFARLLLLLIAAACTSGARLLRSVPVRARLHRARCCVPGRRGRRVHLVSSTRTGYCRASQDRTGAKVVGNRSRVSAWTMVPTSSNLTKSSSGLETRYRAREQQGSSTRRRPRAAGQLESRVPGAGTKETLQGQGRRRSRQRRNWRTPSELRPASSEIESARVRNERRNCDALQRTLGRDNARLTRSTREQRTT